MNSINEVKHERTFEMLKLHDIEVARGLIVERMEQLNFKSQIDVEVTEKMSTFNEPYFFISMQSYNERELYYGKEFAFNIFKRILRNNKTSLSN